MSASTPTWADLLASLVAGRDLDSSDTAWAMGQIMAGEASGSVLGGFLIGLAAKGETVDELLGLADAMTAAAIPLEVSGPTVDIVGTGGDRHRSVNISTMAALVIAGAGLVVVKHGNRAASSASGAADVLEALGLNLDLSPTQVANVAIEAGITFAFAKTFHPSMRFAGPTRSELGIATAFNVLGPLTNPARPGACAIGIANARVAPLMAGVFASRGTSVVAYRSRDGLDEWATTAPADIWEVRDGVVIEHTVDARDAFGMASATLDDLRGGDALFNANVVRETLSGKVGPIRDAVVIGAASAIVADGTLIGPGDFLDRMRAAIAVAQKSIDSGRAAASLDRWIAASSRAH